MTAQCVLNAVRMHKKTRLFYTLENRANSSMFSGLHDTRKQEPPLQALRLLSQMKSVLPPHSVNSTKPVRSYRRIMASNRVILASSTEQSRLRSTPSKVTNATTRLQHKRYTILSLTARAKIFTGKAYFLRIDNTTQIECVRSRLTQLK